MKLPANVRVLLGIVGFPFIGVLGLIAYKFWVGEGNEVNYGAMVLSAVGILMYTIAIVGRLPFASHQNEQ